MWHPAGTSVREEAIPFQRHVKQEANIKNKHAFQNLVPPKNHVHVYSTWRALMVSLKIRISVGNTVGTRDGLTISSKSCQAVGNKHHCPVLFTLPVCGNSRKTKWSKGFQIVKCCIATRMHPVDLVPNDTHWSCKSGDDVLYDGGLSRPTMISHHFS